VKETQDVSTPRHCGAGRSNSWKLPLGTAAESDGGSDGGSDGSAVEGEGGAAAAATTTLGLSGGRPGRRFSGLADSCCCCARLLACTLAETHGELGEALGTGRATAAALDDDALPRGERARESDARERPTTHARAELARAAAAAAAVREHVLFYGLWHALVRHEHEHAPR